MRLSVVPLAVPVSLNSTREEPGGRSSLPAIPHDTTTRCGGSTSRYSPRISAPLMSTANPPVRLGSSSACWPIQDTMRSGVTRCANTTSGGASISIVVEKSAIPLRVDLDSPGLGLRGLLQRRQVGGPEAVQKFAHGTQTTGAHDKEMPGALAPFGDQARAQKHLQVMGDRLLRHRYVLGDLSDRAGLVANKGKDPAPIAVRQRPQGGIDVFRGNAHGVIQAKICTSVIWKNRPPAASRRPRRRSRGGDPVRVRLSLRRSPSVGVTFSVRFGPGVCLARSANARALLGSERFPA